MFPSTLSTFTRPTASDRLNNPSHATLHNTVSSALGQVEAVIGLTGDASTLGTIAGDLYSPDSNGGGHVQTANKGGTGQTSYNKGDLLVATSNSVLAKVAVSSTLGDVLLADPSQSAGVRWGGTVANKIAIYNSVVSQGTGQSSVSTVWCAASIVGSTLGSNNAIRFTGNIPKYAGETGTNLSIHMNYGNNLVASMIILSGGQSVVGTGMIDGALYANKSSSVQTGYIRFWTQTNQKDMSPNPNIAIAYGYQYGTSSVNSDADQVFTVTSSSASVGKSSIITGTFLFEKIS